MCPPLNKATSIYIHLENQFKAIGARDIILNVACLSKLVSKV